MNVELVLAGTHLSYDVIRSKIREEQLREAISILSLYEKCLLHRRSEHFR